MSRRRVLVVSPDFPPARGGIQVLTERVISSWEELEPVVVTLGHRDAAEHDRRAPFEVVRVPLPSSLPRAASIGRLNATAVGVGLRRRCALVLSSHIVTSPSGAFLRAHAHLPYVQYVHAKELGAKPGLGAFALRRATRTVAVSSYTAGLSTALGAPAGRLSLLSPGVDLPPDPGARIRPDGARPTILTISRLEDRYKGHDVILRALPLIRARVPQVRWAVIGEGPLRPVLEERARALGVDGCVEFLGAVSDAERDGWFARADVLCMPSRLPAGGYAGEGFGIVYLEANAHGLPAVAGDVGGATDAVVHDVTGILVPPEDPLALAVALTRVLTDSTLATRLGRAGRRRAEDLAWPNISRRLESLLLEVLGDVEHHRSRSVG